MNSRSVIIDGGGANWALITHWEPEGEVLKCRSILLSGTDHFPFISVEVGWESKANASKVELDVYTYSHKHT